MEIFAHSLGLARVTHVVGGYGFGSHSLGGAIPAISSDPWIRCNSRSCRVLLDLGPAIYNMIYTMPRLNLTSRGRGGALDVSRVRGKVCV